LYIFSQFASGPQLLISQQSGPQRNSLVTPGLDYTSSCTYSELSNKRNQGDNVTF